MRIAALAVLFGVLLRAEPWPLERLFRRPYVWGTSPSKPVWSKRGHVLVFLWNAEGRRFLDLYSYLAESRQLKRLTDLEAADDPMNRPAAFKDDRQKPYIEPAEGIGEF